MYFIHVDKTPRFTVFQNDLLSNEKCISYMLITHRVLQLFKNKDFFLVKSMVTIAILMDNIFRLVSTIY